jgi:hypothetical protein
VCGVDVYRRSRTAIGSSGLWTGRRSSSRFWTRRAKVSSASSFVQQAGGRHSDSLSVSMTRADIQLPCLSPYRGVHCAASSMDQVSRSVSSPRQEGEEGEPNHSGRPVANRQSDSTADSTPFILLASLLAYNRDGEGFLIVYSIASVACTSPSLVSQLRLNPPRLDSSARSNHP